jgi:hypothetical protein
MDDGKEGKWAIVKIGTQVWFPNDDSASKSHEYISGMVVEDNGDRVFLETYDGRVWDISKKYISAYRKE